MRRLLLTLPLLLVPSADACSTIEVNDARGDTSPPGIPGYYDLTAMNLTYDGNALNWSWDVASLELLRAVRYNGNFDTPANSTGGMQTFSIQCEFHAVYSDASALCEVAKVERLAGDAIVFNRLGLVEHSIEGNRLTVTIPLPLLGLDALTEVEDVGGFTQLLVDVADGATVLLGVSPVIQDSIMPHFAAIFCEPSPLVATAAGTDIANEPPASRQAPSVSLVILVLALACAALSRRR